MANIGTVYKDTYKTSGEDKPFICLDIRTITFRKKFTISVNKFKWESGVADQGVPVSGKEDHPDYHIWANMSNRGESIPSQIVGNIKNMKSEAGLKYKKAKLFDPFIQKEDIYFTLFAVDDDKKINKDHLYNVVAQPYRKMQNSNDNNNEQGTPNYEPNNSTDSSHGHDVNADEDEIPF